jgi:formate hydrogenlyase subunit 6/NADH:ubiquinone oxidoreductase subunit I
MRAPKLRELKEAITALIKGPYTAKFPAAPTPLPDTFRGAPRYDEDKCVGCGSCAEVCPTGACEKEDDVAAGVRRMTIRFDRCIFCGQCERNCLTKEGVKQTAEYDLATTDRSQLREACEKALLICETCGAIIGAEDHVRWVARRLGPIAFANPTLLLKSMEELELADKEPSPSTELRRGDRLRVLCPKCRQVTGLIA